MIIVFFLFLFIFIVPVYIYIYTYLIVFEFISSAVSVYSCTILCNFNYFSTTCTSSQFNSLSLHRLKTVSIYGSFIITSRLCVFFIVIFCSYFEILVDTLYTLYSYFLFVLCFVCVVYTAGQLNFKYQSI